MKFRNLMMTGTMLLTMVMAASAVYAEDAQPESTEEAPAEEEGALGGLLKDLFGEEGLLKDALPEKTDISEMIDTAKEKLGQAGDEISEALDAALDVVKSEAGRLDAETLKEYVGEIISHFTGDSMEFDSADGTMEAYLGIRESEDAFMLEHNAGSLEPGDVQIVSNSNIYMDRFDGDVIRSIACMTQNNYTMDEENQLHFLCGAEDIVLLTHQNDQEAGYPVTDAVFAEDGENYMPSIEAMCSETGEPLDECLEDIDFADVMMVYSLEQYLNDHPEVAGIEYDGEIRNAEEMYALWLEKLDEVYAEENGEELTEETEALE